MERLVPYLPEQGANAVWDLHKTEWDEGRLLLTLESIPSRPAASFRPGILHIFFHHAVCTRSLDESYRLDQLGEWGAPLPGVVFRVDNSRFPKEISALSSGAHEHLEALTHYVVLSVNECLDVLSPAPPEISTHWSEDEEIS